MTDNFLTNKNLKLILFGGKGGTGKTTSATATALRLAQKTKKKILIVSTDPAPSLGDSLNVEIGNKIVQIKNNLWAIEFDAKELSRDFRKKNLETIKSLVERGTYLAKEDIELFEGLAIPGMDEVMAIIKIADLLKTEAYDLIILDTAPTGHTKVLLSLPQAMERWLKVIDLMQEKHRFLARHWKGRYTKDKADKFLAKTRTDIIGVKNLLKDFDLTEFVPVTIPEPMSILETEDLIEYLDGLDIKVESIIANRILFPGECEFCKKRAKLQEKYVRTINERFKKFQILKIPLFPSEIRGEKDLLEYAKILFGEKEYQAILSKKGLRKFPGLPKAKMAGFLKKNLNFVICGGKGGVGKTSISAATAIAFAKKYKNKKILITTTDPAHALSNIFDQDIPLDTEAIPIEGFDNLFAIEIDAQKMLRQWKDEYRQNINTIFKKFVGRGTDIAFDRRVMEELMELSPPGLEELMALGRIIDLMAEGKYDIYVLDSAASGHLLRFLETPGIVRDWLKSIFKILLRYRNIVGLVEIKRKLLDFSRNIKRIQETLFGSEATEFMMISIAEEMGVREMGDLSQSLEKLNLSYNYIVLNMIRPASRCRFCLAKRESQERYITKVKKEYPKKEVVLVPLFPYDIRGTEPLKELSKFLFS
ncbi:ArsA family ATPase [Patescibacteria group bacterium]|nr:ArsA family ATPase [Patescibacteria group bacterium]